MSRRMLLLVVLAFAAAGCSDRAVPTASTAAAGTTTARAARERLAQSLAVALSDPATRGAVKRRLDASNAPEGKLQFQALVQADQGALLVLLARASATSSADLLADLDAARGLELYLPLIVGARVVLASRCTCRCGRTGMRGPATRISW